ncbi:MAG: DUF805 domain-containing protein [Opitutales bacterium]
MFKAPFSFSGRITRTEFFLSGLISFIVYAMGLGILLGVRDAAPVGVLVIIPVIWFALAQGWKRSHDAGWHGVIVMIPYVNFVLLFVSGDKETNQYGPNPRMGASQPAPPEPSQPTYTPPPLPEAWERARQSDEPKFRTISFKCGACGAQNANVEYQGTACCQFCGAPKD